MGGEYHQGDIVLLNNPLAAGVVEIVVNAGDLFRLYVSPLRRVSAGHNSSIWCRDSVGLDMHDMSHTRHLRLPTAWYDNEDRTVTIIE